MTMRNCLLHPVQARRIRRAVAAHRYTPDADTLARWAAEDADYHARVAEAWLSNELDRAAREAVQEPPSVDSSVLSGRGPRR